MTQEQIRVCRCYVVAFAYRLVEASGAYADVLAVSGLDAYDTIGSYARQYPDTPVARWYFATKGAEVGWFISEWSSFVRVQQYLAQV